MPWIILGGLGLIAVLVASAKTSLPSRRPRRPSDSYRARTSLGQSPPPYAPPPPYVTWEPVQPVPKDPSVQRYEVAIADRARRDVQTFDARLQAAEAAARAIKPVMWSSPRLPNVYVWILWNELDPKAQVTAFDSMAEATSYLSKLRAVGPGGGPRRLDSAPYAAVALFDKKSPQWPREMLFNPPRILSAGDPRVPRV